MNNTKKPVVIVTGSSGLIGSAVSDLFAAEGFRVVGFDRPGAPHPPASATNVPCDLTSETSVLQALGRVEREFGDHISSVIHLAAYYDFSGEPSPLYDQVTVGGTERLLRLLRTFSVDQFIFSSTMLVHAPCEPGQRIDEGSRLAAAWAYPESKLRTERLIRLERDGIPAVILRIAGVYTDRCDSIPLAHQIQRIYECRLTANVFPGDAFRGQSFVHRDDVLESLEAAVVRRASRPPEAAILIGEPDPLSYDELQRALAALIHDEPDWKTVQIPKAVVKAGAWVQDTIPGIEDPFIKPWMIDYADDHYALDIARARALLGWQPRRSLRATLPKMVEALESDPIGWYRHHDLEGVPPDAKPRETVAQNRA
jgi:nucleoside-diphosphate-sugar epimerase